ncbi:FAD/NAD(P)-binding domain-containing protein [Schizophyllum commune H4-8]|uniref:FAD/NAD(P)-binding domain-containing protein n=1 Tax=Schizophyllum commune (strain H4-8 / FGSC 9210) TaxID=578458 RepID=UPI00216037FF|nr:FAD/NAD(P)-binding domain-containing protein [Schizophyllum commune H4-8]KAI5898058.1 FAD/NAD(P)-binding domain-containing protein [Schizophyllum commune H4-8]
MSTPVPLKINIVGAGLVGLSAALALRQQGHDVQVFEAAARLAPLGAVIIIPPNATRVFERLGFDVEEACRPLRYEGSVAYKSTGEKLGEFNSKYERPSWSVHRHDLHTALYERAVSAKGPGRPVTVHLGARVTTCDPEAGSLVTEDGTTHTADLLIGADGIKSSIRTHVLGYPLGAPASKRAAFRALIPTDGIKDELDWLFADGPRGMRAAFGPERRTLLFTPVRNEELVSVYGVHGDERDQDAVGWNVPSSKEALLEKYANFDAKFKKLLTRADEVKLWQMRALPWHIETWIRGRTCIAGDAAHATLATLGQGFAIGLEDVGALAFLLPAGTRPEDVEGRLRVFQDVRKARAEFVARESIEQASIPEKQGLFMRSEEMRAQVWGYDACSVAEARSKEILEGAS